MLDNKLIRRLACLAFVLGVVVPLQRAAAQAQAVAPAMEGVKIDGQYGFWLPPDVSEHGYQIDRLINVIHWFMGLLFVGWGIFFLYCLGKFRMRKGIAARYEMIKAKPSKYLEVGVAIFEVILLVGFSMPVWGSLKNDLPVDTDNPLRVRVVAEQFAWNFHYPGPDGRFGKTGPQFVNTATNPAGLDLSDPLGKDDLVAGEFHIIKDRPVICEISSKDVIHSFFLPVMRIKQDAIPGTRIPVWFKPKEFGRYEVACAQLCGNNHYKMKALMVIETGDQFNEWLKKKTEGEVFED